VYLGRSQEALSPPKSDSSRLSGTRDSICPLAERRIATLRFDFTGLGESAGELRETTFSHNVNDIVAAADALREAFRAPSLLIGHSLRGTAVLAAAGRIPKALQSLAYP